MKPTKEQKQAAVDCCSRRVIGVKDSQMGTVDDIARLLAKREDKIRKDCERVWGAIALRERAQADKAKAELQELRVAGQELAESYQELCQERARLIDGLRDLREEARVQAHSASFWMKRASKKDCVDCSDGSCDVCMNGGCKQVAAIDAYEPNWKTHNAQLERIQQLEQELALATKVIEHANTALKKI
jgi:hypothetical protein